MAIINKYCQLSYDVIPDAFVLFTFAQAKADVVWFDNFSL